MSKGPCYIIEHNRLVLLAPEHISVNGTFAIDGANRLTYTIAEPLDFKKKYSLPDTLTFVGTWSLDAAHNLVLSGVRNDSRLRGRTVTLSCEIVNASANALSVTVGATSKDGIQTIKLLRLAGAWQADALNRICFRVQKAHAVYDVLTFEGIWKVGAAHQLTYRYIKTYLKRSQKIEKTLIFKGHWDITAKNRLVYALDADSRSSFSFKAQLQSPSLIGKKGVIKYQVGAGARGKRRVSVISLYGTWKIEKKGSIAFVIDYGKNGSQAITFTAGVQVTARNEIIFSMRSQSGKDLGLSVTFNRDFFDGSAKWFLRFSRAGHQGSVKGGIEMLW